MTVMSRLIQRQGSFPMLDLLNVDEFSPTVMLLFPKFEGSEAYF